MGAFFPIGMKLLRRSCRRESASSSPPTANSLRALVKYLDQVSDQDIVELNIPTGIPLVYELRDDLTPIRHFYLGDPEAAKRAAQAVANQLKKK